VRLWTGKTQEMLFRNQHPVGWSLSSNLQTGVFPAKSFWKICGAWPSNWERIQSLLTSTANEGDPLEPIHVHVRKGECVAKFWVAPTVSLADSYGFDSSELRELLDVVEKNKEMIERCWHEYFGDQIAGEERSV